MATPCLRNAVYDTKKTLKGDKVYCPDGTAHLIDNYSVNQSPDVICFFEAFQ
jgi:hypothetical protein